MNEHPQDVQKPDFEDRRKAQLSLGSSGMGTQR